MAPSDSKIIGNATIWNRDDEVGDGGDFEWLTSKPYPVESVESINSSGDSVSIDYGVVSIEMLESSAILLDSSLRMPLVEYAVAPENIQSSATVLESSLITPLVEYTAEPENLNSSATLEGGTLETVLIRYQEWPPESIASTGAEITGGTLT